MITAATLLAGLPQSLRNELLDHYRKIVTNYRERRWDAAELNGGLFCEVVFCIIDGALKEDYPARATKPASMVDACKQLERLPAEPTRIGDRSLRVLIPRALPLLYEIRNNRNVGHVGGDVNPNHLDATAVLTLSSWVLAELIRIFHNVSLQEAQDAVDALIERKHPIVWEVEDSDGILRVMNPNFTAKDQGLLLLYHRPGWVPEADLLRWIDYSNAAVFRKSVLATLHKARLIEHDTGQKRARISPLGIKHVEEKLLER